MDGDALLAAWMAEQRERRGISQESLAERLRLDQPAVSRIERGYRKVTVIELLAWATALSLSWEDLASGLSQLWEDLRAA